MTSSNSYLEQISFCNKSKQPREVMLINEKYHRFMEHVGLDNFDAAWTFTGGEVIKVKDERTVVRVHFPSTAALKAGPGPASAKEPVFYIKKHRQHLGLWQRLWSLMHPTSPCGEGMKEFYNYCRFRNNGLATAIPVAAGIKFTSFFKADSFLITMDFAPLISLEDIVLRQPSAFLGPENQRNKRNILREIGHYARRMHDSGMNQKDFNSNHILLQNPEADRPQIALFDLQRTDFSRLNSFRWPIKALAELNFTLPSNIFTENDRLFLFSTYKGKEILSAFDRWQYTMIIRKMKRISRHTKKRGLAPKMTGLD